MHMKSPHTLCECEQPGKCPVLGRTMSQARWYECYTQPAFCEMFRSEAARGKLGVSSPLVLGPGTELKQLLAELGIQPSGGCDCGVRVALMNSWGTDECERRREEIRGWLIQSALERGWSAIIAAKICAGWLVDEAVRRARVRV